MNKNKLLDKTFACLAAGAVGDAMGAPAVGDIDQDGRNEIIIGNTGGYITALNAEDGSILCREGGEYAVLKQA